MSTVAKRRWLLSLVVGFAVATSGSVEADGELQLEPPLNAQKADETSDQSWTRRGAIAPNAGQTTRSTKTPETATKASEVKAASIGKSKRPIPTKPISGPLDRFRAPISMLPSHKTGSEQSKPESQKPELKTPGDQILDDRDTTASGAQNGWQGRDAKAEFLPRESTIPPAKSIEPDGFRPTAVDNWVARDAINRVEPLRDQRLPESTPAAGKSPEKVLLVPPAIPSDPESTTEPAAKRSSAPVIVDGFAPRGPLMPPAKKSMSLHEAKGSAEASDREAIETPSQPSKQLPAITSPSAGNAPENRSSSADLKQGGEAEASEQATIKPQVSGKRSEASKSQEEAKPSTEQEAAAKKQLPKRKPVKNLVEDSTSDEQRTASTEKKAAPDEKRQSVNAKPAAAATKTVGQGSGATVGDVNPDVSPVLDYTGRPTEGIRLTRSVANMRRGMERVLRYFYENPEIASGRSNWGMMHSLMVYGADTKVIVGRRKYSAIAWIAGNNNCRGQRLLTHDDKGIHAKSGVGLQGHQGQFLAVLAMCNVPLDYPLYAGKVKYSVAKLLEAEKRACKEGAELTFTLIGLSHYLDTDTTWTADDGQQWSFEKLIEEELKQPIVGAACGGTHRLMGYAHALRKRRAEGKPITGHWRRAEVYTNDFIRYAYSLQNRDGSMSTKWFEGRADNGEVDRKIQTTGHIVEWLLSVTPDEKLQDRRLVAAVNFLLRSIANELDRDWSIGPKGHALRSLAMYHQRVLKMGTPWIPSSVARTPQSSKSRR